MARVYSDAVRARFLALVCAGSSFSAAEALVGVADGTGRYWWRRAVPVRCAIQVGGRGPRGLLGPVPADEPGSDHRGGARRALSVWDRSTIAVALIVGCSHAAIGRMLGRDRSVICREVARNTGPDGRYWAPVAHRAAHERRKRPKAHKLALEPGLCAQIEAWMDEGWSPRLIAQVLAADPPGAGDGAGAGDGDGVRMGRVSHETIYQALYVQGRGALRQDLHRQLSTRRSRRRPRTGPGGTNRSHSPYREAFTISQRPAEVADRAVPGHWEGDLIMGPGGRSAIGTLVERSTRFTILLHLPGRHDAGSVAAAMIREMAKLPEHLRRSLTWDRGTELASYRDIELNLKMPVYFCDPHSPWQRGSNENTNRLLRFWFAKGTDLSVHTRTDLDRIAAKLNARPRPTLNLQTPAQRLTQLLADPGSSTNVATTT